MNNSEWTLLKFCDTSYYLHDENNNDNLLYFIAIHNTLNHLIIARAPTPEFKRKAAIHRLYINQDDGLGRYKVQTNKGEVSKQFYVPIDYVVDRYERFKGFMDDFKKVQNASDVYLEQTLWCELQDNSIHWINLILSELEGDLKQEIDKSLTHDVILTCPMSDVMDFDDSFNKIVESEKKMRLQAKGSAYPIRLILFSLHNKTASLIHVSRFENDVFVTDEKVRILVSKYNSDYYVLIGELWRAKNAEIEERESINYQYGNIAKLSAHEKIEILTFVGKTKNSLNRQLDKSEVYEIIREKQNDEESRILEFRKFDNERLEVPHRNFIGSRV
jgi:hypothetical protein